MEEYTCMIPRETQEGAFYRAALALHQNHFQQAQAVSDVVVSRVRSRSFRRHATLLRLWKGALRDNTKKDCVVD